MARRTIPPKTASRFQIKKMYESENQCFLRQTLLIFSVLLLFNQTKKQKALFYG
jgi:hypothetical protein